VVADDAPGGVLDDAGVDPHLTDLLPEPYARALDLVAEGLGDDDLARALDIEPAALPVFLEIAAQKAAHATAAIDRAERDRSADRTTTPEDPRDHGEPT